MPNFVLNLLGLTDRVGNLLAEKLPIPAAQAIHHRFERGLRHAQPGGGFGKGGGAFVLHQIGLKVGESQGMPLVFFFQP